jgi:type I restriction enzyme S subunit
MTFAKYPSYKASGVEWLGEVPSHWQVKSIKWLSQVLRGASPRPIEDPKYFDDNGEFYWVRISDVSSSNGMLVETQQRLSTLGSSLSVKLEPGDLFVSIAGSVGKPCITKTKVCIHDGFVYFPKLKIPSVFLYRIFEAGFCYEGLGKMGTQLNLNTDTIGSIKIALPPQREIENILSFLDRETAKIDALRTEQERLIELLREKRQATISHAVTQGLNPHAPRKASGVPWLADVPAHWEIVKTSPYFRARKGSNASTLTKEFCSTIEGSFPVYSGQTENDGIMGYVENFEFEFQKEGVLLTTTVGAKAMSIKYIQGKFSLSQNCMIIEKIHDELNIKFYYYHFISLFQFEKKLIPDHMQPSFRMEDFYRYKFLFPPLKEQEAIANYLDRETGKLDALIEAAEQAISLLQERRTALISAAVTGAIDLRAFSHAAPTPEAP